MTPIRFPGYDTVLGVPSDWDAAKHGPCDLLPIMRTNGICISVWRPSLRERFEILFGRTYGGNNAERSRISVEGADKLGKGEAMTNPTSPPTAALERAREFLVRWPPHIARSATEVEMRAAALTDLAHLLTEDRTKALSEREAEIARLREALASAELTIERQNRRIDLLDMPANGAAWLDRNRHPKW